MTEKYPSDTVATIEDFRASKWKDAISSADGELSSMSAPFPPPRELRWNRIVQQREKYYGCYLMRVQ